MTAVLERLSKTIADRRAATSPSYVAGLLRGGAPLVARKFGEEAVELIVATLGAQPDEVVAEAADVLFHLLVLLEASDVPLERVMDELGRREGTSGLAEKASRDA